MSYFLANQKLEPQKEYSLAGEEARHILLSRRTKKGEVIELQDVSSNRFRAVVLGVKKDSLEVKVVSRLAIPEELGVRLVLFQAWVAEKALDLILQKATELGAYEIVLFNSANVATRIAAGQFQKKLPRWEKICWEAAKQSGRAFVPKLEFLAGLDGVVAKSSGLDKLLVLDVSGSKPPVFSPPLRSLGLVVGPEGGLTPGEAEQLGSLPNCRLIKLSPFTLRSETAAISALAVMGNL